MEKKYETAEDTMVKSQSKYIVLFSYHWEVIDKLLKLSMNISDIDYKKHSCLNNRSIHELWFHLLRADHAWRLGLENGKVNFSSIIDEYPNLISIINGFEAERKEWDRFLLNMDNSIIDTTINMIRSNGEKYTFVFWRILEHVLLHGMQHLSEISQLLTEKGFSPGNIDFVFYREIC